MKKIILIFLLFCFKTSFSQYVTTIFNSNSIQIDDAIILDKYGNIYGSHYMGSNVHKIDKSGLVSIVKSGLNTPNGLAFDSHQNLYIVDNIGNRIYKIDSTGNQLLSITLNSPSGIIKEIDSDTMIVTQYSGHAVRKIAPNGQVINTPMHYGFPLNGPVGMCYSQDSTLYIGNFGDRKIFKYVNDTVVYIAQIPASGNVNLGFLTYANGLLYGTSFQSDKIYEINPNYIDSVRILAGSIQGNIDGNLQTARFNNPNGIFASKGGDSLLVSDFNSGNIRLISGLNNQINPYYAPSKSLEIYPNPCNGEFAIKSKDKFYQIEIVSLNGKSYFKNNFNPSDFIKIKENLPIGCYFILIKHKDYSLVKKLFVVK
ncbi:MAG: T9SS C-terminal target domain-containing protein [Bacteroidetes bacterium]|nr:MAG: T9SS C-terminal target domain-containing protein [Bacteroidota bacterium]MBL1145261.1 T9SS C-terminal target domain-containing protein [Bacteroidota bacterium]NOG58057.1 T9SS type A sorting domain-containing protein [Bacteroidota bacterium]